MRRNKVYEVKRRALGLSQAEVGKLAGVSGPTVSSFENGKEISNVYANAICRAIDDEFAKLDRVQYMESMLTKQVFELAEVETEEEKSVTLAYIALWTSKLQLELAKKN